MYNVQQQTDAKLVPIARKCFWESTKGKIKLEGYLKLVVDTENALKLNGCDTTLQQYCSMPP